MHYYNENDPLAAAWLEQLIEDGHIPDGIVDRRSITEVKPRFLRGFKQHHFFAGISGWSLALARAGWPEDRPICTASLPCQPFSVAGKQLGTADKRHLWPVFFQLVRECRFERIIGEQVPRAIGLGWLDGIQDDLEKEGYTVGSIVLAASSVGAPHIRQRLYWVADSELVRERRPTGSGEAESGRTLGQSPGSGDDGGLANTPIGGLGINGSASGESRHVDERGESGGLGRSISSRSQGRGVNTGEHGDQRTAWEASEHGRLGESNGSGSQPWQPSAATSRHGDSAKPAGFWDDYTVIRCSDGKSRRIGAGIPALAAKFPRGLVPVGDPSPQEVNGSQEARVMRLRGYGNSLCVETAAVFIRAVMEVLEPAP